MNQTELKKLLNKQAGRSKYGNHKVHCLSKHLHDSKLEANYCNRLLAMKQAGEIILYEVQKKFPLTIKIDSWEGTYTEEHICDHIVDFYILKKVIVGYGLMKGGMDYIYEVHDTKGMKTDVWRIKHKLFQVLYPEIPYRVITAH